MEWEEQWARNAGIAPEWVRILERRVPAFGRLGADDQRRFGTLLKQFLRHKPIEARAGMRLDEDVKVTIAGSAVRMILHLGMVHLTNVARVAVYPHVVPTPLGLAAGQTHVSDGRIEVRLGWEQVLHGLRDRQDGYDVLVHEFAHALDSATGAIDGTPALRPTQNYEVWGAVLHRHFVDEWIVEDDEGPLIREHSALNKAEFFAAASEVFFELPDTMATRHPALYNKLRRFYGQDPRQRTESF